MEYYGNFTRFDELPTADKKRFKMPNKEKLSKALGTLAGEDHVTKVALSNIYTYWKDI